MIYILRLNALQNLLSCRGSKKLMLVNRRNMTPNTSAFKLAGTLRSKLRKYLPESEQEDAHP